MFTLLIARSSALLASFSLICIKVDLGFTRKNTSYRFLKNSFFNRIKSSRNLFLLSYVPRSSFDLALYGNVQIYLFVLHKIVLSLQI